MLFQIDMTGDSLEQVLPVLNINIDDPAVLPPEGREFALFLTDGVLKHQNELDLLIRKYSKDWSLERLPRVDRSILRLAIFELTQTDTPGNIVINEAVEMAKEFSAAEAPIFINGLLDNIWKQEVLPFKVTDNVFVKPKTQA